MTNDEFVAFWRDCDKTSLSISERESGFARYREIMGVPTVTVEERETPKGARFLNHADMLSQRKPPEWLIRNVLPRYGVGLMFGADGTGKTFLALDIALSIASGSKFFNRKTKCYGPVLYVVAEGRIEDRVQAWLIAHNKTNDDIQDFYYMNGCPNIGEELGRAQLASAVDEQSPCLIFIDTLASASPSGDENSKESVGPLMAFFRDLANLHNCSVVFISHRGKDVTRGVRGWSGQRGNSDCVLEITRDDDLHTFLVSKLREGEDGQAENFVLEFVTVGEDEDGPYQSRVVKHIEKEKE